ncbi:MAG: peptide chain release factor N(5)-glutamine methyltransferase [bacterium]
MTVEEAVGLGKSALRVIGESEREIESNIYFLLSSVLNTETSKLKSNQSLELIPEQIKKYNNCLERRLTFEPAQYITGETEFWSLPIMVGDGVLVPRQDTETLTAEINKYFQKKEDNFLFLDMCCGSGCIGISLLDSFPNSKVVFSDKYLKPIEYTKKNLKRLNFDTRAVVTVSDMFSSIKSSEKFDAIVSNPPYIPSNDLKSLSMQITLFEPIEALQAGDSGLVYYQIFASEAKHFLKPNAPLFLEIGYNQAEDVIELFRSAGWQDPKVLLDLAGNARVLFVRNN